MGSAGQNLNGIQKRLGSSEIQVNRSVAFRLDVCKHFCGCDVISAGIVHYIQVRNRSSIDRECDMATILQESRSLGKQKMNFVDSWWDGIAAMKGASSPAGKELRVFRALNYAIWTGERAASRAEVVGLPGCSRAIDVGCSAITGQCTDKLGGDAHRNRRSRSHER